MPQKQPLPIVLAAALRARQKSAPGGRLATLTYRYGEEQAEPKYGGGLWIPAASGAALALLAVELVPDQWLGHPRAAGACRTVAASGWPRTYSGYGKGSFSHGCLSP